MAQDGGDAQLAPIDPRVFRDVLGSFATGVVIVTTRGAENEPVGLTVSSFNSVSLDPPLILWSLALKAPSLVAFRAHQHFAINILAETQLELCKTFGRSSPDKFLDVSYRQGVTGAPLLAGAAAHLECRTYARYPGGDHEIYVGEVVAMEGFLHEPLLFHGGAFRKLQPTD
jgi:flavin reductase (DIM6/NTAB) family NADH-FMN oxidoreductase RutF